MKYRPEIDGLRAVAVFSVIAYHAGFRGFSGGFVGVDAFFVISGFLITTIILNDLEASAFSLRAFYVRRARRILPALALVLVASLPFAWFLLLPNDMEDFLQSIIGVVVFASNILFWRESGYFDTSGELKPLLHTWSLSVEEQFYVLFPIALLLCMRRLGQRAAVVLFTAACVAGFWFAVVFQARSPNAAFYLLPSRVWELLIGVCAAFACRAGLDIKLSRRARELLGIIGLFMVAAAVYFYDESTAFPSAWTLAPTIGSALLVLLATSDTSVGQLLASRRLVQLGLISYSAYLWHTPAFAFTRHWFGSEPPYWVFVGLVLVVLVVAWLSWRFVETPVRRGRGPLFPWVVLNCALIGFAVLGLSQGGFAQRFSQALSGDVGQVEFHKYIDQQFLDCQPTSVANGALSWDGFLRCKQSKPGTPDVVLLGDSHAEHLFIGVAEALSDRNVAFYIQGDVPSVSSKAYGAIFDELLSNGQHQHIVLTMHYVGRQSPSGGVPFSFSETARLLKESGKSVTLVGDIPRFDHDPGLCKFVTPRTDLGKCAMSQAEAEIQMRVYEDSLLEIGRQLSIPYISLRHPLCSFGECSMISGRRILYRDDNHLNIEGSRSVGGFVAQELNLDHQRDEEVPDGS